MQDKASEGVVLEMEIKRNCLELGLDGDQAHHLDGDGGGARLTWLEELVSLIGREGKRRCSAC